MRRSDAFVSLHLILLVLAACTLQTAWADPPVLYSNPAYESPVRGDPDDLLLISGSGLSAGDTVVYRWVQNTNSIGACPFPIPTPSNALRGIASVVSAADAPYSLTVHLPSAMVTGRSYALWVVNPAGESSAPILINDARPLWITPDSAYRTASLAGLPRVLKVVGRNLHPAATYTSVQLVGMSTGTTYTLTANNTSNDPGNTTAALERYVAAVNLPATMTIDQYTVAVSRDELSWVPLMGNGQSAAQLFTVNEDPTPPSSEALFDVGAYSDPLTHQPCQPNDGIDDTGCIVLAIRDAQLNGGGTVTFGAGTWLMSDPGTWAGQVYSNRTGYQAGLCPDHFETCGVNYDGGVLVPIGINLQGAGAAGADPTVIQRGNSNPGWPGGKALFTLQGGNSVAGIEFTDDNQYTDSGYDSSSQGGAPLALGLIWFRAQHTDSHDPTTVSNVVITNNVFSGTNFGIRNGGLPIDHVYITNNTFGAWDTGIFLDSADPKDNLGPTPLFTPYRPYDLSDSIIAYNTFYPSGYTTSAGAGPIATNIAGGLHLDFSNNLADGTAMQYLNGGPGGWRAAFFANPALGHDMTLVSSNSASCTGDKNGDGEFISYDGANTLGGMPYAEPVLVAGPWTDPQGVAGTTLTVQGPVQTQLPTQTGGAIDVSADTTQFYAGYWLQVLQGAGKGQWRKLKALTLGSNAAGPTATMSVTPAFDVLPDASSMVIIGRGYWQNATVNNSVDQTTPLCTKGNPRRTGGVITYYASTADSAIEGNQQYDTSGIFIRHAYLPTQPGSTPPIIPQSIQSNNEVRNNLVSGTYDWSGPSNRTQAGLLGLGSGGIQVGFAAQGWYCGGDTCPAPPPAETGFGISIAGNTVINASARDVDGSVHPPIGAIGLNPGWETGPTDSLGLALWPLGDTTIIFNNSLQGISNSTPGAAGGSPLVAIGVDIAQGSTFTPAVTWRTILYNNSCSGADTTVKDFGLGTVRYCPDGHTSSCECAGVADVDVGIAASSSATSASAGTSVTYTVTVTNNDAATTAVGVSLSLAPSAGVQIAGASFNPSQGTCDQSVNVCLLGSLGAGKSASVTVTGSLPEAGTWPVTFSVTHQEADGVPINDSVTVTESVQ